METLITKQEIVNIAFHGNLPLDDSAVGEATIIAAQHKFIKPVVNGLYPQLLENQYPVLLDDFIKPALAYYVKLLVIPTLSANVGSLGIVRWKGDNFTPANQKYVSALRKNTRSEATALMRRAVEHIESTPAAYPEYDPSQNILKTTNISSNIVL